MAVTYWMDEDDIGALVKILFVIRVLEVFVFCVKVVFSSSFVVTGEESTASCCAAEGRAIAEIPILGGAIGPFLCKERCKPVKDALGHRTAER